jgi:hypothetical protein
VTSPKIVVVTTTVAVPVLVASVSVVSELAVSVASLVALVDSDSDELEQPARIKAEVAIAARRAVFVVVMPTK